MNAHTATDLSLIGPYGINLTFHTNNYAAFIENVFAVGTKLKLTPGARLETIDSKLDGLITNATFPVHYSKLRTFPLFGLGVQYDIKRVTQLYANISQAYRPYLYANVTPADQIGRIDPNLKDSKGYDVDLGYRGQISDLVRFDVNVYYLFYGNKIGKLTQQENNTSYQLTTNIGNSVAKGFEMLIDISVFKVIGIDTRKADVRVFSSTAYTHARYRNFSVVSGTDDISIKGNRVEGTPEWIERSGLEVRYKSINTTFQTNHVSGQFNDANNTRSSATGIVEYVPAYTLFDWSFEWRFLERYHVAGGVNNLANVKYFSRRINMYPGPGILPGDGRSLYLTVGARI